MIALVPGQLNLMTMTKQCAYFMGYIACFKILKLRQNGSHFAYDYFKSIFSNENVWSSFETSLKYVPKHQNNNIPTLIQIMAWCWPGDKPLVEPMMVTLLMHICVTRPQRVGTLQPSNPLTVICQLFALLVAPLVVIMTSCSVDKLTSWKLLIFS